MRRLPPAIDIALKTRYSAILAIIFSTGNLKKNRDYKKMIASFLGNIDGSEWHACIAPIEGKLKRELQTSKRRT